MSSLAPNSNTADRTPSAGAAAPGPATQSSNRNPQEIGSEWMAKHDAAAAAHHLANGARLAEPTKDTPFTSPNHARIHIMAYAIQNQFSSVSPWGDRTKSARMCCYRSRNDWVGRTDGDCRWMIHVKFKEDGSLDRERFETRGEHSHTLNKSARPTDSPLKKIVVEEEPALTEGRVKNSKHVAVQDSGTDSAEESEANSSDSNSDSNTDSTGSSEEEIVASRPRKSNLPTGGVKGNYSKRGSRVKHLAEELVKSGKPLTPIIDCHGTDPETVEIAIVASALSNGFAIRRNHSHAVRFDFRCSRYRLTGCKYAAFVQYNELTKEWKVDRISVEHNHGPLVEPVGEDGGRGATGMDSAGRGREEDEVERNAGGSHNRGGRGNSGRPNPRLSTLERPSLTVASGGGVSSGKKRERAEEIDVGAGSNPRVVASKGSNSAGLMLPPPKRSTHAVNAVASGSGSKGTVATQYSSRSSSQRRLLPSSTTPATAPRLPPSIPVAPRPWPVELARLIAIANTVLLDLSHVFAAIFIEAGVVNRYEFSKLLWTFSSENMKDERMLWFIERLLEERNGIALSRLQVIQFRSGAKRLFARIVAKTAKK